MNLLNISLRGSFPPPPPFTHHTASALAGWSLRKGRQRKTEEFYLASKVLLVLVPFSCGRGKYWSFLSWARFCVSDRILFLGISHLLFFMTCRLGAPLVHFCLLQTTSLEVPYPSEPTFWIGFLSS